MADKFLPWEELKKDWSDKYPDDFWLRVQNEHPEGMHLIIPEKKKPTSREIQTALNTWLSWHKSNPVGEAGYAPRPGIAGWQDASRGYASLYLSQLSSQLDRWAVEALPDFIKAKEKGEITPEMMGNRTVEEYARYVAAAQFAEISAQVTEMGLHSGLPGVKDSGIWSQWTDHLNRYSKEVVLPNGSKVYDLGGFYYNPNATKIPASEQTYIRDTVEQQEEQLRISKDAQTQAMLASAEAGVGIGRQKTKQGYTGLKPIFNPKTAFKDYFDLQDRFNELERPDIKIMSQSDTTPLRGGDNDVIITSGPAEAARLGYGSWVDEREWNSPKVQNIYFSELNKNILAAVQRLDMSLPEGVTGSQLHGMSLIAKLRLLNPSEISVASQLARSVALESTPSGIKPGWIRIKSSRDPRPGPKFVSPGEYKAMRDKKKASKSEMAETRALHTIEKYKKEKLLQSYQQFALGGEAPEVTKGMSGEALAEYQRRQRMWEKTPELYELPGEKTPEWMPQFVPGLTAGQPLKLGHQVTTPSGQGWRTTTPSQREYLQRYMATSEQVVPGYLPRRTYEDIMHEMGIGKSKSVTGARGWRVSRQRS